MSKTITIKNSAGEVLKTSTVAPDAEYAVSVELRRILTNVNLATGDTIFITCEDSPVTPAPETTPVPAAPSADTVKPVDLPLGKPKAK